MSFSFMISDSKKIKFVCSKKRNVSVVKSLKIKQIICNFKTFAFKYISFRTGASLPKFENKREYSHIQL